MTTKNAEPVIHNRIARRRVRRHRTSGFVWCGLTYDNAGNTTYIAAPTTGKTFVYGDHNRLTQVLNGATVAMNYVYNGMGERVRKYLNTANTYTLYDDAGRWLGDYGNAGAPTQQVIWFDDLPVGVLDGAGANQKLHYIEPDALGTPRVVIDRTRGAQGVAIWRWDLTGEAFGTTAPNENPDGDATTFVFDMRFPGQRYDAASGLNYNYFREYEPGTGRYSQSDPIGLAGGMSTYGYVGGNSMNAIDPNGLFRRQQGMTSGLGMAGDAAGIGVGLALLAAPTGVTQVLGVIILAKSLWGFTANTYNFARAFSDDASYDLADKYNSPTRALANWIAPCNEGAQRFADIADLGLDMAGGRAVIKRANLGGYMKQPVGYPYKNTNPVVISTADTLVADALSKNMRLYSDFMQISDMALYVYDAHKKKVP